MKKNIESQLWREALIQLGSSLQQAIFNLEKSGIQIALVISEDDKLIGTLTDGDIRRAFLRGMKLDNKIDEIIHRDPFVVPPEIDRDLILQIMQANRIHQLPIVDEEGKIIGLHLWDSVLDLKSLDNLMIIMAGGQGTRLLPHTENCPKPMLEIGGKPILEHIIERAKLDGFHKFIISLCYLGEMIEEYFGDGSRLGVQIDYIFEDSPLGTAGCLSILKNQPAIPFIVANGDVLTDIHFNEILDFHMRHNAIATMAVREHEIQNQFGVVKIKGIEIDSFEEKPVYSSHINAGIYVLSPEVLNELIHKQYCDMPTLFERVKEKSGLAIVYPMHEPWLDIGRPMDLAIAKKSFS
jgi:dTDP-glucose pyrophosphorylase